MLVFEYGKPLVTVICCTIVFLGSLPGGEGQAVCRGGEATPGDIESSGGLEPEAWRCASSRRHQPAGAMKITGPENAAASRAGSEPAAGPLLELAIQDRRPVVDERFPDQIETFDGEPTPAEMLDDQRISNPGNVTDEDDGTANITARRNEFRAALHVPLSNAPVQMAMTYVDDDRRPVPTIDEQKDYLVNFAGYYYSPLAAAGPRTSLDSFAWYPMSAVWKSPDICYGPLYFEEANLERFGARFPVLQPGISAAHFFSNTLLLPYSMGRQPSWGCYYSAGYGRPGNSYCYRTRRPVWSLRGATFQSLLVTGLVFALP